MDPHEARRRDAIIRAYIEAKDWDANDEFQLKRHVISQSSAWLPDLPWVVEDEWDVVPGKTNHGRGDLVFTDGDGTFAVVEVKHIDLDRSGATARTKRKKSRNLVRSQALGYAQDIARRHPDARLVLVLIYTNEAPEELIEVGRFEDGSDGKPEVTRGGEPAT